MLIRRKMNIVKFNPWWSRLPTSSFWDDENWPDVTITEGLDVYEKDDKICVEAAFPGISQENIDITYEDGVLHMSGESKESEEDKKNKKAVYKRQMVRSFDYRTVMPRPIDIESIEAVVRDGVLKIEAKIAAEAQPKKIKVKTG